MATNILIIIMGKVDTVKQYVKHRWDKNLDALLGLVTDNIEIVTIRGESHKGKAAVRKYLEGSEPTGTWDEPHEDASGHVVIKGKVSKGPLSFSVVSTFTVDGAGHIEKVVITKS